jgi:hypothetical protein
MSNVSNPKLWETIKNKVMKMETSVASGYWDCCWGCGVKN